jgi:hypothetical protein
MSSLAPLQIQEGEDRVRGRQLALIVPRHSWTASVRLIHGSPPLHVPKAVDVRQHGSIDN